MDGRQQFGHVPQESATALVAAVLKPPSTIYGTLK